MSVVFYFSFVCISAYANVYFKTILQECLRAGLPPGTLSTAPPPVCVSAVLGTLTVWIPNQTKKNFQPRAEGEVKIFGFCNNKQKNKDGIGVYLLVL